MIERERLLVVGHGRMGQLVERLAGEYGFDVAATVDSRSAQRLADLAAGCDVAIDFSVADAVVSNVTTLARAGVNVVVGTTGWHAHEDGLRELVAGSGVAVVAAANFSTGVVLFTELVRHAADLLDQQRDFGAWVHEAHHAAKKDAPSGTALALLRAMEQAGYTRPIDIASTRAGHIPGTHTVGFDGPAESITLSHVARDRSTFARGALLAARWVKGRRGWFTMKDVLGL